MPSPTRSCRTSCTRSGGLNLGLDFLPGALTFNPAADPDVDPDSRRGRRLARRLRDEPRPDRGQPEPARVARPDRGCIDHGAALYVHHTWRDPDAHAERRRSSASRDHVLLPFAGSIADADARLAPRLDDRRCSRRSSTAIPDAWLPDDAAGRRRRRPAGRVRALPRAPAGGARPFVEEAERARRAA